MTADPPPDPAGPGDAMTPEEARRVLASAAQGDRADAWDRLAREVVAADVDGAMSLLVARSSLLERLRSVDLSELPPAPEVVRAARAVVALDARRAELEGALRDLAALHGRDLAAVAKALYMPPHASEGEPETPGQRWDAAEVIEWARLTGLVLRRRAPLATADLRRVHAQNMAYRAAHPPPGALPVADPVPGTDAALGRELARALAFAASLGAADVPCRCGSGGHPRRCARHPWRYDMHVMELDLEVFRAEAEAEDEGPPVAAEGSGAGDHQARGER